MSESEDDKQQQRRTPPVFLDCESATEEALQTFTQITACSYQNKSIGDSGQNENMTCDCHEKVEETTNVNHACGDDSGCINRATSVECMAGACNCGDRCQNQRFQRCEYAAISVFQTEKKGYGVRADTALDEGSFIYEYIGEVIDEATFRRRMVDYDSRQLRHFYFMMLKKDAFIDATEKGALARFVNHSCSPNAYVDKWVVGDKLRMGIFAKRHIARGEEITFDYNVDRYGAQSQPCYCGEPNCIKFMGGKTQTDAALLLPDGISEALGVTPRHERQWLKENKHLRTKQQNNDATINEAFVKSVEVSEIEEQDVNRVMAAMMKSHDANINRKLVERIYLTDDENVNRQIVRMHGYKTLSALLKSQTTDPDTTVKILKVLAKWPKMTRNKIQSSQIEDVVKDIRAHTNNREIRSLSVALLDEWGKLQMAYRIPKVSHSDAGQISYGRNPRSSSPEKLQDPNPVKHEEPEPQDPSSQTELPPGWESALDPNTNTMYYFNRDLGETTWERPQVKPKLKLKPVPVPRGPRQDSPPQRSTNNYNESQIAEMEAQRLDQEKQMLWQQNLNKQKSLQELILQSQREAEERKAMDLRLKQELTDKARARAKAKSKVKGSKSSGTTSSVEKRWSSLFAKYVPNLIKKHTEEIGKDNVKQCAREMVKVLVMKEMNKDATREPPADFEKSKLKQVKEFTGSYMDKFMIKYRQKHSKRHGEETEGTIKRTKLT
ncbi:histone methyltransferase set2 [Yamadazyma tenuis]|uniref:Histone-lysine N-methyltransferase, H3 lysine-36 specific n=1 Tax=Candida tenuis (strain ATCC 10573 / BCRC 21748 / CBS 615 / JCM 9827 / NBRC 10315 / NRRL Y-1498 / VKM Y-70) TaxID=590646 RepID=G3BBE8_CANTC|nr:SET domain-containing protein [Yamadazyma tenuis ATCC 10573]EGV62172.1 SET domain-containing protein [Yamadazyma tenuis ATCC 10573]WEJ93430.1 histone methyltransferase set2 [Yamadazyma tenuis]